MKRDLWNRFYIESKLVKAQVSLTPTESKNLISKGVLALDLVKSALKDGIVVIHPSTTTYFLIRDLIGKVPKSIVSGVIIPSGACIAKHTADMAKKHNVAFLPEEFRPVVLKNGELQEDVKLGDILKEMGPNDVYIKAGNAIDIERNVGVLIGSPVGGTISRAFAVCAAKGVNLILPTGLEKLIPVPIREAVKKAGIQRMDYSMGMPVGLLPVQGIVVTEIDAIEILTGAIATPIAAGGILGAEGSITFVIEGEREQVVKAVEMIESIKGSKLPEIILSECLTCGWPTCPFKGKKRNLYSLPTKGG
ncbi:MAG: hypothetical protein RMJ31_04365 [Nitrososphaerota archaeon]|nr:hypothetical protein [Nitrososphaerales archaeon]MDW8044988.1 hypothetical protein [Nitrososphaerota archaeon]